MNTNDNDCDKTTIKVQVSDAYRDIIIDWSKEYSDIKKEMFRQVAEFTGISIEKTMYISFSKPPVGNDVYPENPFVWRAGDRAILLIEKSYPRPEEVPRFHLSYTMADYRDKFFRDGDCFALNTRMEMYPDLDNFSVQYTLVHRDLIDETECNQWFCHHISNKAYLTKQAKITNSNIEKYLRDQPRPNVHNRIYDDELHAVVSTREREIHADLDIGQYFNSYCSFSHDEMFRTIRPRIYWPNRG